MKVVARVVGLVVAIGTPCNHVLCDDPREGCGHAELHISVVIDIMSTINAYNA